MVEQLGKIEKPEAGYFTSKRKLCLIPLIFSSDEAPADYVERFNRYWEQVSQHLISLESKMGKVKHVYHESITSGDDQGLKILEKLNPFCYQIAMDKCQNDAVLDIIEDNELFEECIDWERCLVMGFISQKAARVVSEFYMEASKQRYEHIARRIDESLKNNEMGILFIREGHGVQFPADIEVFSVAPPALDEINRWRRDLSSTNEQDNK